MFASVVRIVTKLTCDCGYNTNTEEEEMRPIGRDLLVYGEILVDG